MIELWIKIGKRNCQRCYGTLNAAMDAARKELEAGNAIQIVPGREEPDPHADPCWDE